MKKFSVIAMTLIVCFTMISCTGDTGPQGPAGDPSLGILCMTFQTGAFPYGGYDSCVDSYVSSASPTVNYETNASVLAGQSASTATRTFIKFDVSAISPNNVIVKGAYLSFNNVFCQNSIQQITAYKVTQFWDNLLTWNTYNGTNAWTTAGGDYSATAASDTVQIGDASTEVVLKLDNTMVSGWLADAATNYGVVIKGVNEGTATYGTYNNYSSDSPTIDTRPKLTIYYTLP